jgi:hypothetical protein
MQPNLRYCLEIHLEILNIHDRDLDYLTTLFELQISYQMKDDQNRAGKNMDPDGRRLCEGTIQEFHWRD